jgi:hypothetical protein
VLFTSKNRSNAHRENPYNREAVNAIIFIVIGILREDPLSTAMLGVFYVLVMLLYEVLGAKTREHNIIPLFETKEHVVPLFNKQGKTSSLVCKVYCPQIKIM